MAVGIAGREGVLEEVRDGLLVGALGPAKEPAEHNAVPHDDLRQEDGEGSGDESSDGDEDIARRGVNGRGEHTHASTEDETRATARRVRALMLKAAAMAGFLREELGEFKMPQELH